MENEKTRFRIESDNDISDALDTIYDIQDSDDNSYENLLNELRIGIIEWLIREIHSEISYDDAETILNTYIVMFNGLHNSQIEEIISIINLTHKEK